MYAFRKEHRRLSDEVGFSTDSVERGGPGRQRNGDQKRLRAHGIIFSYEWHFAT